MSAPSTQERPIDKAISLAAAGDALGALRHAVPVLTAEPGSPLASFVVGHALGALGDSEAAERALTFAASLAVDASNLALAVAAGASLRALGVDPTPVFDTIAAAFAKGSARLRERRVVPPDLPGNTVELSALPDTLSEEELKEQARAAVAAAQKSSDETEREKPRVSPQALFSALSRESLREMIAIFEVRIVPSGARLIEEGSVGSEAFIVARGELDVEKRGPSAEATPVKLARLGAGALVGEMALLSRAPRAATVTTLLPSIVLVAQKEALERAAATAPEVGQEFAAHCKRRMIDNLVRTSALFRAATPAERPTLVERFVLRTFEPGEALATQGERSSGLHLIASGEVSIQHREGDERTLVTKLGAGDVVGEVALIFRRPAIADAIATHPTVTLFLPEARLLGLVRDLPKVFADLYALAVRRDVETASIAKEEATEPEEYVLV